MKKLLSIFLLAFMVLAFYGCPIGLDYSLGDPGKEKIDEALIGTWTINEGQDGEVLKVQIAKRDGMSYTVTVLERGEMYSLETDNLTGWVTTVSGEKFLYLKPDDEAKYYHYHYRLEGKKNLFIHDVSLLDGGIDVVNSTESLRDQVASSMTKEGWGKEELGYTKP